MSNGENPKPLQCANCRKTFTSGTLSVCPFDGGDLLADPFIGTIFAEKYEILSLLGEGGMSKVYKARHTLMNRIVAIKLLHDATKDSVTRARFRQEAEAASALSHPNVVTVHDFGLTADDQPYFIMDCLEGKSLAEILEEKGFLDLQEAVEVFTQACEGLDHAHRKGIIHRDIKPSNLIVIKQEDGYDLVKLVDFGIAKFVAVSPELQERAKRITQTGEVFGTPAYMSPEQCNGRPLDARSDLYSFGCLMYETIAGEPPLCGDTFVATVMKHVNHEPIPLSEKSSVKVPVDLEAVIMKCLEKDPDKRYNSAAQLKQALFDAAFVAGLKGLRVGAVPEPRTLANSGAGQAPNISVVNEKAKGSQRKYLLFVLALCLLGALAGAWVLFYFPGPDGDYGSFYDKFCWQAEISAADDLLEQKKFGQAIDVLQDCTKLAMHFKDDNRRLESALTRLVTAYEGDHQSQKVEEVNSKLVRMADQRVYDEFDGLMQRLKQWEQPTASSVQEEVRAQQATAFGERIARCADKLSIRSRKKQEALLKRAVKAYDMLSLREGVYRALYRIQLADIYRSQQRYDEQRAVLEEAVQHSAVNPQTELGWRYKIQTNLLLGELNCNSHQAEKAMVELGDALKWTRERLPNDRELRRGCLNALIHLYGASRSKANEAKAAALAKEVRSLNESLVPD